MVVSAAITGAVSANTREHVSKHGLCRAELIGFIEISFQNKCGDSATGNVPAPEVSPSVYLRNGRSLGL